MTLLISARLVQGAAAGGLMSLAMAAVGDLVSPRERGRYQGYIVSVFAVATVAGPLVGGLLVDHASWRWVFYVNLPLGLLALAVLRLRMPATPGVSASGPLDVTGAGLLAGATSTLMLACIWGGTRYAWDSATILGLLLAALALSGALIARERRAEDPIVPLGLLRSRTVAVASAALFLTTGALFAVNVFVPLFLQATTGASPTRAGLLLVPMMLGITLSTNLAGRAIQATGRYKRYPILGLALMTAASAALAVVAGRPSQVTTGVALAVFGLGFGMVGQVLTVAVQNDVDRTRLGTAMATTSFFRALGGAVGAAVLGAVFAARSAGGAGAAAGNVQQLGGAARSDLIDAVQTVFWVAAPIAALGLLVALLLPETPLAGPAQAPAATPQRSMPPAARPAIQREKESRHVA
jgi:MFS family permease